MDSLLGRDKISKGKKVQGAGWRCRGPRYTRERGGWRGTAVDPAKELGYVCGGGL